MTDSTTPTRTRRRCPHCDGFPVVHVTTGNRHRDGTRATLAATCPACQGTGTVPRTTARVTVGGRA